MERVLSKKAAARAMAAPAPAKKKKKLVSTIIRPSVSKESIGATTISSASKKRKVGTLEDEDDSDDERPEHDLDFLSLLSPSIASKKSKKSPKFPSANAAESSGSSLSETTSTTRSATKKPVASKPRTGAEVVVFDASKVDRKGSASSAAGGLEFNFKKFMSSKISKLDEAPAPTENPLTAEEKAEELENKRNDTELHNLIKASHLLEQYNADQLDGVERRRHQRDQLINLGIQKKEKVKVPLQIGFGMIAKKRERDMKELEEAKNNGMYHKSLKHTFAAAGGKKKERPRSERGLKTSMGRFKNGMLTLTQKEIKSVQREGTKPKSSGKKSGGKKGGKKGKGRF